MATINFNGKTYNSLEEMPVTERQAFEQLSAIFVDKNGNGIPDFLEGDLVQNVLTAITSSVHFDGQTYKDMNELPPEVRDKVQGAFRKLSKLGIITGNSPLIVQSDGTHPVQEPMAVSRPFVSREYSPTIHEENNSNSMIWIVIAIGLFICLALAVVDIFLFMQ